MKIFINGKEISKEQMKVWRYKRTKHAAKLLGYKLSKSRDTDVNIQKFEEYKGKISYEQMTRKLKNILSFSTFGMKIAVKLSRKRKTSVTVIRIPNLSAREVSEGIDKLMTEGTADNYLVNLAAYPEHYALCPTKEGKFEVVETPGNSPFPVRFFITFGDENGLVTQKDETFQFQSTGVAKLQNGEVIGGVRHQFKDVVGGCEARLTVEFPSIMPQFFINAHQWHLATEFDFWFNYIADKLKENATL